jgi:hypothetical protein
MAAKSIGVKKRTPSLLDEAASATLSLFLEELRRHGSAAIVLLEPLIPKWDDTYSEFERKLRAILATHPELSALFASAEKNDVAKDEKTYAAEAAFARLLPAWDAYVALLNDPHTCDSLSKMISRAAEANGIEACDVVGQEVTYNPIWHAIASTVDSPPRKVVVIRRGFLVRRIDGSVRCLIKTYVEPA